jgi:glucose-6-phosphate 1-dehydrogenase
VIRVQPDEGDHDAVRSKVPGTAMEIRDVNMDFAYGGSFTEASPEAYERLILDVLLGDRRCSRSSEEVEQSWKILDPILEHWGAQGGRSSPSSTEPPAAGARMPPHSDVWRRRRPASGGGP